MALATAETIGEIKARGAFYTPDGVTRFLAAWAMRSRDDMVLEPSCGDGAFISAIVERFRELDGSPSAARLVGVERDPIEAKKARVLAPHADIRTLDFFDLDPSALPPVDAAIGNPPYIRYHGFHGLDREKALLRAHAQGVELTGLASSWAHFVAHAAAFLKPTGRLALVLPAELLHTDYGQPVRDFLLRRFRSVVLVAFDRMVFADAQVDAVLLLASHDGPPGLRVVRVRDEASLHDLIVAQVESEQGPAAQRWNAAVDVDAGRIYHDSLSEFGYQRLGAIASVDIGFVSGANDFFVLSAEEAGRRGLAPSVLTPAIRRPRDVPGLSVAPGELSWLLNLRRNEKLDRAVRDYLAEGESRGVSGRYKCRVRRPWYSVPLPRQRADAFLPYMAHLGPRLIVNDVDARSTNLLHGVALRPNAPPIRAVAVAMCSSLTLLSAEIEGRAYGGGVLKLETREAERLAVPALEPTKSAELVEMFDHVDGLIRSGRARDASIEVDRALGIDRAAIDDAYLTFRNRRLGRRQRGSAPS
jgi:adenine-specific DNA methylase